VIGPCDAVLVLVKAHQTAWATEQASALLKLDTGPGTVTRWQGDKVTDQGLSSNATLPPPHLVTLSQTLVVTLQNGVGNREILAAALGEGRVGQGVTALGATLLGPGCVRHAGQGTTTFGAAPDRQGMAALAELFRACGLPAELSDDLDALVWGKLVVNAGINALTALLRVPNGALAADPAALRVMSVVVAEAVEVAQAKGITLPFDDAMARVVDVCRATAANRSSMLQDVLNGRPTEVEYINGAIAAAARAAGLAAPANQMLVDLIQATGYTAHVRIQPDEEELHEQKPEQADRRRHLVR
jgi:2-dehydropantoate 2-reductase